jgi:cytidine deaminase
MNRPDEKDIEFLLKCAREAREAAYAPYSGFKVGAALLTRGGRVFKGCNVENVSYGAANCAERTAVFSAVAAGCRDFDSIAIYAGDEIILPCGICRQVLAEFSPDITVICGKKDGYELFSLSELLPHCFNNFSTEEKKPNV